MDDRSNTIAMMVLAAGIVALGASIVTGEYFHAERPEKMGYTVQGVEAEGGGGAAAPEHPVEFYLAHADPAKGADVFKKCQACHTANQGGANGTGPNLYGVVGEAIGQGAGGFAFSDALKAIGGNWDFTKLNTWLTSPKRFANGTKMTFAGLSDPQERANVIAFLNTQNAHPLPLPAAPAEAPAAAAGGSGSATADNSAGAAAGNASAAAGNGSAAAGNGSAAAAHGATTTH